MCSDIYQHTISKDWGIPFLNSPMPWDIATCVASYHPLIALENQTLQYHLPDYPYRGSNSEEGFVEFQLLYLWYKMPSSIAKQHRVEIRTFQDDIKDEVPFRTMNYQELYEILRGLPCVTRSTLITLGNDASRNEWHATIIRWQRQVKSSLMQINKFSNR
jgi:hypothetical protein